ncbi:MAG: response regulator [Candidatus Altiarchaeales archaeon]|nr:response regulator [Candidatus Altiarchaeales archaeon]
MNAQRPLEHTADASGGPTSKVDMPGLKSPKLEYKEGDTTFNPNTQLGKIIAPVVENLARLKSEEQTFTYHTFKTVYESLKDAELSGVELTEEDRRFLVKTRVGELLRRVILHGIVAQRVDREIKTETNEEREIKAAILTPLYGARWSKWVTNPEVLPQILKEHKDEGVFVHIEEAVRPLTGRLEAPRETAAARAAMEEEIAIKVVLKDGEVFDTALQKDCNFANLALGNALKIAENFVDSNDVEKLKREYDEGEGVFYSEPVHAFSVDVDLLALMSGAEKAFTAKGREKVLLPREASIMVVEDNIIHRNFFMPLDCVENLKRYAPHQSDATTSLGEGHGYYKSAERALEVIDKHVAQGGKPPDILVTDIELAGNMTGLELVRRIKEKYPKVEIMVIYSSNIRLYKDRIDELENPKEGEPVIQKSYDKRGFDPFKFLDFITEKLKEGMQAKD